MKDAKVEVVVNGMTIVLAEDEIRALRQFADASNAERVVVYNLNDLFPLRYEQFGLIGWHGRRLRMTHAGLVALALGEGTPVPLTDPQRLALERAREATDAKVPFFAPSETKGTRELSVELRQQLEALGFLARREGPVAGPFGYLHFEITPAGRAALEETDGGHAEVDHPLAEPQWEVGKHDWRDGHHCAICWVAREREGDLWVPTLVPCVPRLAEQVSGFYTTAEAARKFGISRSVFVNRLRTRAIVPAAVSPNNVYYWRWDQLAGIAEDDQVVQAVREGVLGRRARASLFALLVMARVKVGRPVAADELDDLRRDLDAMLAACLDPRRV